MNLLFASRPAFVARLAEATFWAALIFTVVCAIIPPSRAPQLMPWDKAEHFLAFYVLTVLAAAAFPRERLLKLAALLSVFGGLIELIQALPIVHRDCDYWDWVADTVAIAAALGPLLLPSWRQWLRNDQ